MPGKSGDPPSIEAWLDAVAAGSTTMNLRPYTALAAAPGGIDAVRAAAAARAVHLVVFGGEADPELVVATREPVRVLC